MSHQSKIQISGSLLARNSALNLIGQMLPLLVGLVTIPFIVRGLGTERYGLLSLAWVVLGYFAAFDLGLGRATTRFVAEALGRGAEGEVPGLVWMSVTVQAAFGIVGSLALAGSTPLLVHVLNIPRELVGDSRVTFYLLALSVPVVLMSGSFRGVLEAGQRFDLVNLVTAPASSLTFVLPLIGLLLRWRVWEIVALILLIKVGTLSAFVALALRLNPGMRRYSVSIRTFPSLFSFGGWVMVYGLINPLWAYLDRFLIAALLALSAVSFYSLPYDMVTRLLVIPASLAVTIFPALSALNGVRDNQLYGTILARSCKYILVMVGPVVLVLVLFGEEILRIWVGSEFAAESTMPLRILALGILMSSVAQVPFAALQGFGRPDLAPKLQLLGSPLYVLLVWFLTKEWGIVGTSLAMTLRVGVDTGLLFLVCFRVCRLSPHLLVIHGVTRACLSLAILTGICYVLKSVPVHPGAQAGMCAVALGLFGGIVWKWVLDERDHSALRALGLLAKVSKRWGRGTHGT